MSPRSRAAATSAGLSALFLVVYPLCNVVSGLRSHVPSLHFGWEQGIPFVPALIVPYMSIDLFFVAAPFLARSDRERLTLAHRIAAAILIAAAIWLTVPLRFAFERPQVDGMLGAIFNNFRLLDQPFNQCPSLHIALCSILADSYLRWSKGPLRWGLAIWFALIALSAVLTYQHHVIDVIGGAALAVVCFYCFGDEPWRQPFQPNRRVGSYYALGALVLTLSTFAWPPWTSLLAWPAVSLLIVAAGYFYLGASIYRKQNGKLPLSARLLLAPVLLGQRLSRMHYSRRCNAYDRITDHLWIGRSLSSSQARCISGNLITAVVDLTAEFSEPAALRALPYLQLPVLDLTAPTPSQIDQAVEFICNHAANGNVYVHCKIGYSRTAVIAGAYLLTTGEAQTTEQALATLRRARPSIVTRPEAVVALEAYAAEWRKRLQAGRNS